MHNYWFYIDFLKPDLAYSDTMFKMVIVAAAFAIVPFYLSLKLPDISLADKQSVVTDDVPRHRRSRSRSSPLAHRSISRGRGLTSPISG